MRIRACRFGYAGTARHGARFQLGNRLVAAALLLAGASANAQGIPDFVFGDGFESAPPDPCASIVPPAGYTRETPPATFPEVPLVVPLGFWMGNFPQTGGQQGRVTPERNHYVSIEFFAPANPAAYQGLARRFSWQEAQQGGLSSDLSAIYLSVSQCPGDFRIPPTSATAPQDDPTFASGCRNYRPFFVAGAPLFFTTIEYDLGSGPAGFATCMINPGHTYYFNMILASPVGGIQPGDNPCSNASSPRCGIQMSVE